MLYIVHSCPREWWQGLLIAVVLKGGSCRYGADMKKGGRHCYDALLFSVPGPGLEPGWVAPTVFETVASTDSAIRASCARHISIWHADAATKVCFFSESNKPGASFLKI